VQSDECEAIDGLLSRLKPHQAVTSLRVSDSGQVVSVTIENCMDEHWAPMIGFRGFSPNEREAHEKCLLRGFPRERAAREVHERWGDHGHCRFTDRGCEVGVLTNSVFHGFCFGDTWSAALAEPYPTKESLTKEGLLP